MFQLLTRSLGFLQWKLDWDQVLLSGTQLLMVFPVSHAKAKILWIPLRKAFSSPHMSGWLSIPYFHPSVHFSGSICLHCAPLPSFHFWRVKWSQQGRGIRWECQLGQSFTHWSHNAGHRALWQPVEYLDSPKESLGFPDGSHGKVSACNAGDPSLIPGLGRFPGERNGNPLQYSRLENSMDEGAW